MLLLDYWYHGLHRYEVLEFTNTDHLVKERFEPKVLPSDVVVQLLFKSYLDNKKVMCLSTPERTYPMWEMRLRIIPTITTLEFIRWNTHRKRKQHIRTSAKELPSVYRYKNAGRAALTQVTNPSNRTFSRDLLHVVLANRNSPIHHCSQRRAWLAFAPGFPVSW